MGKDENKNLMTIVALPYVWFQENSKEISFFYKENDFFMFSFIMENTKKKIKCNWN